MNIPQVPPSAPASTAIFEESEQEWKESPAPAPEVKKIQPYYVFLAGKRFVALPHSSKGETRVWATIKKTSKYEYQGRAFVENPSSVRLVFPVDLNPHESSSGHQFRLCGSSGGQYRREDIDLYLSVDGKEFVKI